MSTLSNDIARCPGVGDDTEGWREGCDDCLRRTAPRPDPGMTESQQTGRGGKRPGSGRPESAETIAVPVRLTPEQAITLRKMSVAKWLRPLLDSLQDH